MLRLTRSAAEATAFLAMLGVIAIWGLFESATRTARSEPNATVRLADLSGTELIAFEGSIVLTKSPVSKGLLDGQRRAREQVDHDAIATSRSGLTTTSPNIISLTPGGDSFGGDAGAVLPALPSTKKSNIRTAPSGTYRTLCVRLCDGYYWPVSFSTTSDGLGEDKESSEVELRRPGQAVLLPQSRRTAGGCGGFEGRALHAARERLPVSQRVCEPVQVSARSLGSRLARSAQAVCDARASGQARPL